MVQTSASGEVHLLGHSWNRTRNLRIAFSTLFWESSLIGSLSPTFSRVPILQRDNPFRHGFPGHGGVWELHDWCLSQSDIPSDRWIDNEVSVGFLNSFATCTFRCIRLLCMVRSIPSTPRLAENKFLTTGIVPASMARPSRAKYSV